MSLDRYGSINFGVNAVPATSISAVSTQTLTHATLGNFSNADIARIDVVPSAIGGTFYIEIYNNAAGAAAQTAANLMYSSNPKVQNFGVPIAKDINGVESAITTEGFIVPYRDLDDGQDIFVRIFNNDVSIRSFTVTIKYTVIGDYSFINTASGSVGTEGSVPFWSSGQLGEDNTNFFWDAINNGLRLGVLTESGHTLDVGGIVHIEHTAASNDEHGLGIICDANNFADVKCFNIVYKTGILEAGEFAECISISLDREGATGGSVAGIAINSPSDTAVVYGMFAGVGINPITQASGTFGNMDSALVIAVDRLTEFTTSGVDIVMFVADNDTVTIGDIGKFEAISFVLATIASGAGILPVFEFSTGVGTWSSFSPLDGTNAMTNSGVISWMNADIPTWAIGTGSEFLIRITRTRNSLTTSPIEDIVQISLPATYTWNDLGDLNVNNVTAVGGLIGDLVHVKNGTGAIVRMEDLGGVADDKIGEFEVDGGVCVFRSLTDVLGIRTDNILVMDLGSGDVGMGTINPDAQIHIKGTTKIISLESNSSETSQFNTGASDAFYMINSDTTDNNWVSFVIADASVGAAAALIQTKFTNHVSNFAEMHFVTRGTSGIATRFMIGEDGDIGINDITPDAQLDINARNTTTVGLIVNAFASATADTQRWDFNGTTRIRASLLGAATSLECVAEDLGNNVAGPSIKLFATTNVGAEGPAPGTLFLEEADGQDQYIYVDNSGDVRIHTAAPTGSTGTPTVDITAGIVVGTQTSWHEAKDIIGEGILPELALQSILDTKIEHFTFKSGSMCNQDYHGPVIYSKKDKPWFGQDWRCDKPSLNTINIAGYSIQAFKALNSKCVELERKLNELSAYVSNRLA